MVTLESLATLSPGTALSSGNVIIGKPTGLTVGDLMVAVILTDKSTDSFTTPSGWTKIPNIETTSGASNRTAFYKYAESADTAASNFTFATVGTVNPAVGGGAIYRLSGVIDTDPQIASDSVEGPGDETTVSLSTSIDIVSDQSFIIIIANQTDASVTDDSISNVYVTGGDSPTFTVRGSYRNTTDDEDMHYADGTYVSNTDITAFGWDTLASISGQNGGIIVVPSQQDATGTHTLISTTSTVFGASGSADGIAGNTLVETASSTQAQTGLGETPTQWTNETKPSTNWTNEQK